jgi:predicted AAA+ superfamily ATPase
VPETSRYLPRTVDRELDLLLTGLPAISLEGPKAVGKTATALRRAASAFRLDDPDIRQIVGAGPDRIESATPPVLIDEWQRLPDTWDRVRRAVDTDPTPGRFLLTGSASLRPGMTHSGAGRIVTVRMRPMTLAERGRQDPAVSLGALLTGSRPSVEGETALTLEDYAQEIVASGFPGLRSVDGRALRMALDGYLDRIVEADLPELGRTVRNPAGLRRWMRAYAAATSTTAAYETIRAAATAGHGDKPARATVQPYIDALERLWILDPVPAWLPTGGGLKRLAAAEKHQLADPALAARLLGLTVGALVDAAPVQPAIPREGSMLGALFESLVTLQVRVAAQAAEARVFHLRTKGGEREVDLIVERGDGKVVAIEVKLTRTPIDADVRHLRWLADQLGDELLDAVIVTTGPAAYRRGDGIAVVPAALLGP